MNGTNSNNRNGNLGWELETKGGERALPRGAGALFRQGITPWEMPVEGAALLDELEALMRRYVVLPKFAAEALALWVVHTYAFGLRDVSTYLGIESPDKRCGKTTLLGVLGELVNRPVVAANISSPAFFRVIQEAQPTLIIDEADTFLQANDELRGILNSGYSRKTAFVVRVANETGARLVRYSCWCPKVMAAIGRLPDTLADRCIIVQMQRKLPTERCERLRNFDGAEFRRKCIRFVKDHWEEIKAARPEIPADLNDRAADIWEPLLALAELAGGEWPEKGRNAAIGLTWVAQGGTPIGALLLDIFILFSRTDRDRVFSRELVEWLNSCVDRPWAEMNRGRPVTDLWVAQQLRRYGVQPRAVRMGKNVAKGYLLEDLKQPLKRYITKADQVRMRADWGCEEPVG